MKVIVLVKGFEQFVFFYSDERLPELFNVMSRYAADPDLNFTWYDVSVLSRKVRADV